MVEITGLQEMPKLASLHLETQPDTNLYVCKSWMAGGITGIAGKARTGQAGTGIVL
jgi:hypothetical protein